MIRLCSIGPLFILFVPLTCRILFFLVDYLCCGLGMVSLIFTTVGSIGTFQVIYELTKTFENKDIYYKSMAVNQQRVPIGLFLVSCYICTKYLHPIFDPLLKNDSKSLWFLSLKWMSPPYETCTRLATAMVLLGLVVILRYVGPTSISTFSYDPLVSFTDLCATLTILYPPPYCCENTFYSSALFFSTASHQSSPSKNTILFQISVDPSKTR